jgi:hypothetical protein
MSNYDNDIEEYWHERMTDEIRTAAGRANYDLMYGPTYYDADAEPASCFDESAIPFDFQAACRKVRDWADENMYPLFMEDWCGMLETSPPEQFEEVETEDGEVEYVDTDRPYSEWDVRDQMKIVFGELARYL